MLTHLEREKDQQKSQVNSSIHTLVSSCAMEWTWLLELGKKGHGENISERQRFSVMTAVGEAGGSGADGARNLWL